MIELILSKCISVNVFVFSKFNNVSLESAWNSTESVRRVIFKTLSSRYYQKQPSRCVLRKRCSENIQQIYRRTPMPKYDFNTVALQPYWKRTLLWCSPVNLLHIFRKPFPLDGCFLELFSKIDNGKKPKFTELSQSSNEDIRYPLVYYV